MKKDIHIPEVSNVFMAIVKEYNDVFKCDDWNAYLVNDKDVDLETVLIVSSGFDKDTNSETAVMRHKIAMLPQHSYAKIEMIQDEVVKLTNSFHVTFFSENRLFEKKFIFEKGTVKEGSLRMLPILNKRGILLK